MSEQSDIEWTDSTWNPAHGLPTEPPSACFIHVSVSGDPREFYIPLPIAEIWELSPQQTLTQKEAIKLSKAVERYLARRQTRGRWKMRGWLSEWRIIRVIPILIRLSLWLPIVLASPDSQPLARSYAVLRPFG